LTKKGGKKRKGEEIANLTKCHSAKRASNFIMQHHGEFWNFAQYTSYNITKIEFLALVTSINEGNNFQAQSQQFTSKDKNKPERAP
jgi:hypothetical protein